MSSTPIRILVVDDHPLVRQGIALLLAGDARLKLVGEAGNCADALELLRLQEAPDILLLDISLPDGTGIDLARKVREKFPDIRILFLSMHEEGEFVRQALRAGASGFVQKSSSSEDILNAILTVNRGERFLSPSLGTKILDEEFQAANEDHSSAQITDREREVLRLVVKGNSAKEIAEQLSISHRTVETHRQNLIRKLGAKNSADLVRLAYDLKYV